MCEIENGYTLGSYAKSHEDTCIQGRSWGGSACGRDRKRRVVHKETKCLFAVGVVCEVSAREPQTREIDVWGRCFVCMVNIHST